MMHIKNISLANFRNFKNLEASFTEGTNIFFGKNGSGKTNFLESLFVLCLGRSQLGSQDQVLVNQDKEYYRLAGEIVKDGRVNEAAVAYQKGGRKKITLDGINSRAAELFENFSAVSTGPEDSVILSGGPSMRRLFLDIHISQLSGKYINNLSDYQKALAQKNAALKNEMDPSPFDALLISTGSSIIKARGEFIEKINEYALEYYADIANGEKFKAVYEPSVNIEYDSSTSQADIETKFVQTLEEYFDKEYYLKTAIVGPHRDEIYFEINNLPARQFGSQGQWRTAAVSLKLAVYRLIKEKRELSPILLLDEIFAELDSNRRDRLIKAFGEFDQLFLTTAQTPPPQLAEKARNFKIVEGAIESID